MIGYWTCMLMYCWKYFEFMLMNLLKNIYDRIVKIYICIVDGLLWYHVGFYWIMKCKAHFFVTLMQSWNSLQYFLLWLECPLHVASLSVLCTDVRVINSKLVYLKCLRMQRKFQFRIIDVRVLLLQCFLCIYFLQFPFWFL